MPHVVKHGAVTLLKFGNDNQVSIQEKHSLVTLWNLIYLWHCFVFQNFIAESDAWCKPDSIHICDGSEAENNMLLQKMEKDGEIKRLTKYKNWYVLLLSN